MVGEISRKSGFREHVIPMTSSDVFDWKADRKSDRHTDCVYLARETGERREDPVQQLEVLDGIVTIIGKAFHWILSGISFLHAKPHRKYFLDFFRWIFETDSAA
ncbi:hypothetical protein KM043_002528 [Ampulex compressa]|nr:hypothetical protein KM043_002528 [Ampulex compressa]